MYEEETIISVCVVQGEENFITRIADVRGNELILHAVDLSREYKGFNRDKLYYNRQMEPSLRKGHMGVWKWSVSSNHIEPGKERVSSEYQKYLSPVEVVDCRDKTKEELQVILKDGTLPQCSHQRMLWFRNGSREQGILCEPSKLEQTDNGVRIKGNVYGLPCYDIKESDLLRTRSTLGISERCLYRFLQLPQDSGYLSVRSPAKAVKDLLVKRLNWKFVKDHSLGTREDHKKFRRWMEVLPEQDIIEDIADCCHYSKREADACWKIFVDHIKQYVRCEDIETKVLQGLLEEDGNLQMRLKEEWHNTHRQELEREKTEYRKHRTEFEVERNTLEKEREELKAEQARLQREVEEAKACLDNVREEAKRYEELGRKSLEQVREKLSLAREEAAEFLANLALFGTPGEAASVSSITGRSTLMTRFLPGIVPKEWEPVVSVEEELEELKENLRQAGTDKEHLAELAAYLYGAFQNKTPLLLAGPQGIFVANAISCSMTGRYAAVLDCCGEWDSTLLDMAREGEDKVIIVKHPFHSRWIDHLVPELDSTGKMWIFVHPYAGDLSLETSGLYQYILPLVLDIFIAHPADAEGLLCSRKGKEYKEISINEDVRSMTGPLKKLCRNLYLEMQVKQLMSVTCGLSERGDEAFLRCGCLLFPLAIALGRKDIFLEIIQGDLSLS